VPGSRHAGAALGLALAALTGGCRARPAAPPPIVLVTVAGLRADAAASNLPATGALFDPARTCRLAAVATSSAHGPALASLITGLSPWRHRLLADRQPLDAELRTMAEALTEAGYKAVAFQDPQTTADRRRGFDQGVGQWGPLRDGRAAGDTLRRLDDGEFLWFDLAMANTAYPAREDAAEFSTLTSVSPRWRGAIRRGVLPKDLLQDAADAGALSPALAERAERAYGRAVQAFDRRLDTLWRALADSPAGDRAIVVLVGVEGEPLGEGGEWRRGRNLDRANLEVPLWIRSPAAANVRPPCGADGVRVSAATLFASTLQLAGISPPPGVAPPLGGPAAPPAIAELYRQDGANRFVWVDGDRRFFWRVALDPTASTSSRDRRGRRRGARDLFRVTPPFSGAAAEVTWSPWGPSPRRTAPVEPAATAERAAFRRHLLSGVDRERSPEGEAAEIP
jgi:arylsulfatase A-like enzyme